MANVTERDWEEVAILAEIIIAAVLFGVWQRSVASSVFVFFAIIACWGIVELAVDPKRK